MNYYEILGVPKTATQAEIKKAYFEMVKKYHPDIYKGEDRQTRMTEINVAYDTLKDSVKRKQYNDFGHETYQSARQSQNQEYSQSFEEMFEQRQQDKTKERYISRKANHYFLNFVRHINHLKELETNYQEKNQAQIRQTEKLAKRALRNLLKTAGMSFPNKNTHQRIVNEFYKQNINTNLLMISGGFDAKEVRLVREQMKLQGNLRSFLEHVENKYLVEPITAGERRAIELFHQFSFFNQTVEEFNIHHKRHLELLRKQLANTLTTEEHKRLISLEKQTQKDIGILRQILSALGLPGQVHHEFLLRAYMDGLKESFFSKNEISASRILPGMKENRGQQRYYGANVKDLKVKETLNNIKIHFDEMHFQNLKEMRNPFSAKFLKGFPVQFLIFQMAVGASLYRQAQTDPLLHGAMKSPDPLSEMADYHLTPEGVLGFFIFVAVSQQMNYRIYSLGRFMDSKVVKTPFGNIKFNGKLGRALAPGTGMGTGYFVSTLFAELLHDPDLKKCTKSLYSKTDTQDQHMSSCEKFYLTWSSSEKWKHYVVDIGILIGSGILSHKFVRILISSMRSTIWGSKFLMQATRTLGLRATGFVGIFFNLYMFLEFHTILDQWLGQPLKELWTATGVKEDLLSWTEYLKVDLNQLKEVSAYGSSLPFFKETISSLEGKIKKIGHRFQHWTDISSQHYSRSVYAWNQKVNKLLLPYEGSQKMLENIFVSSQLQYDWDIMEENPHWDSHSALQKEEMDWWSLNQSFNVNNYQKWEEEMGNICTLGTGTPEECQELIVPYIFENPMSYSAYLIFNYLDSKLPEENPYAKDFANYLGERPDEVFSSDPKYSRQRLSSFEKLQLSKILLEKSLNHENILNHFSSSQISYLEIQICDNLYPNHKNDESENLDYERCRRSPQASKSIECSPLQKDPEAYNNCIYIIDEEQINREELVIDSLITKSTRAGLYILKEMLGEQQQTEKQAEQAVKTHPYNGFSLSIYNLLRNRKEKKEPFSTEDSSATLKSIEGLLSSFDVYKKGEMYFLAEEKALKELKSQISSDHWDYFKENADLSSKAHVFLKSMLCGGEQVDKYLFSIPALLASETLSVYDFDSNRFESLQSACEKMPDHSLEYSSTKILHNFLFNQPVKQYRKQYENLYLAVEDRLRENYANSQYLKEHFQKVSEATLKPVGEEIVSDLESLTENYYKNLVNLEADSPSPQSLSDFTNYYNENKIFYNISSFNGGLKGLEISLFQVNFWMNQLKTLLILGDKEINENGRISSLNKEAFPGIWESFNKENFERNQEEVLQLIQSYHDSYKKGEGPYLTLPNTHFVKQLNQIFNETERNKLAGKEGIEELCGHNGNRFLILQKEYAHSPLPVLMESDVILFHILSASIPFWENFITTEFYLERGSTRFEEGTWKQLIYSVVFELNRSLNSFMVQLAPLSIKETSENRASSSQTSYYQSICKNNISEIFLD